MVPEEGVRGQIINIIENDALSFEEISFIEPLSCCVNVQEKLKDPLMLKICKYAEAASDVQLWYDQFLPTEVAADHLDISQKLFGLSITPEEACRKTQEAMAEYLSNRQ